jgi:hypothetical protein
VRNAVRLAIARVDLTAGRPLQEERLSLLREVDRPVFAELERAHYNVGNGCIEKGERPGIGSSSGGAI